MVMNRKIKLLGIVATILMVAGLAYWLGASVARAQMGTPPSTQQSADPMTRMAAALERMATAMEQMRGGMGQGMTGNMMGGAMPGMMGQAGQMGSMMQDMQGMMQQMQAQMGQMMQSCQSMTSGMAGMPDMTGPMGQTQSALSGQLTEKDLTQTTSGAAIDVSIAFMNPLLKSEETNGKLVFKVALNTHSVDLTQFDLTKLVVLRTSDGTVVAKNFSWEPQSESSHHRLGLLKVDATVDGKALITKETKFLELELKGIGTPSRLFKWEGAAVKPVQ
jgi:hypothetical protein